MNTQKPNKAAASKLAKLVILIAAAAFIGVAYFGTIVFTQLNQTTDSSGDAQSVDQESSAKAADPEQPLSILPKEPAGVTVIAKQPEEIQTVANNTRISVGLTNQLENGFAMEVGSALSFVELSGKFAKIAELNGKENFDRLEPRALLSETVDGLRAKLLIGPFKDEAAAKEACDVLILPAEETCSIQPFDGELIGRE